MAFHPASGLDEAVIGEVQATVRRRLLRVVEQHGLLEADEAQIMAAREHGGGFSVDAGVRIGADDRAGLERLREIDPEHLMYESTKPGPGGSVSLLLTPMQLLDRLAALIPPPAPPSASLHRSAGAELSTASGGHRAGAAGR